jgi:hypothetical protein
LEPVALLSDRIKTDGRISAAGGVPKERTSATGRVFFAGGVINERVKTGGRVENASGVAKERFHRLFLVLLPLVFHSLYSKAIALPSYHFLVAVRRAKKASSLRTIMLTAFRQVSQYRAAPSCLGVSPPGAPPDLFPQGNRERKARSHHGKNKHMKTIPKFIFGFPMLALACGSIFAQNQFAPLTPADSAAKAAAAAQREAAVGGTPTASPIPQMVEFDSGSRWHLNVQAVQKFGLVITGASFQKAPGTPFIYVLFDGRLGEIFVPYHSGGPRYGDISGTGGASGMYDPMPLTRAQFPPPRQILPGGKICKEKREYLAWMNSIPTFLDPAKPPVVRYGQEVVYFSVLMAANYAYIMEWTFRDDGTILVRAGSTGPKASGFPKEGHMHDFTWRLDIDLNGVENSAYLTKHVENLTPPTGTGSTGRDNMYLISVEGSRFWKPQNFNSLQIFAKTLVNGSTPPRKTSYELVPMRSGTARHSEPFTKKDFWVSRYNPAQSFLAANLPDYVRDGQSTVNQDLVIWYTGSEHHETDSRDEDKDTVPILWTGFELIPNNLFDGTPFYPTPTPTPHN